MKVYKFHETITHYVIAEDDDEAYELVGEGDEGKTWNVGQTDMQEAEEMTLQEAVDRGIISEREKDRIEATAKEVEMSRWKRYTICNVDSFVELLLENLEGEEQPTDAEIKEAGFEPEDEELCFSRLAHDWNGHKAGARIIHGLTVEGHPFAVETNHAH